MGVTDTGVFWRTAFILFLGVYLVIILHELGHGLASLDAHAVVKVTRELVDQHRLEVSRPPGHPTTEIYLFPLIAWLAKNVIHGEFTEQTYLVLQGIAGVAALCLFYRLLGRLGTEPWKTLLATICLGLSPEFFANTIDGEEFVFAVLFLTISLYLLVTGTETATGKRFLAAIWCFAFATGCRPEVVFAGFIFPLYCVMHPKCGWKQVLMILLAEAFAVWLVWLPIVFIGLHTPYTAGMNLRESILGGAYRLVFQCFTLPVFILICWVLFRSFRDWPRRVADAFPANFIFIVSCVTPVVFFAALFLHASKPAHVLFAVPFVLLLVARRSSGLLISWTALAVVGLFVTIDIFKDRQLAGPHLVPGAYFQSVWQKPFYKLEYLKQVATACEATPTVVIADLWPWDFEYHTTRGTLAAHERTLDGFDGARVTGFEVASAVSRWDMGQRPMPQCLLLPRDAALHQDIVQDVKSAGYEIKIDAILYRTLFSRYNITAATPTTGKIGSAEVALFPTSAPWR